MGNKKFDLKPLGEDNNVIENTKPTVELELEIDNEKKTFKKIKSSSTEYFIDEVPKKAGEFNEEISSLISEKLFMALINPVFFGDNYKWNEQKSIILDNFDIEDTVIEKPKYKSIKTDITSFGVDDTKNKYDSKRKELEKDITKDNGTKEYIFKNTKYEKIDDSKEELINKKDLINKKILEYEKSLSEVYSLRDELLKVNSKIEKSNNKKGLQISEKKADIKQKKKEKANLLIEYKKTNNELKNIKDKCSLCGSKLDLDKVEKQKQELKSKIDKIVEDGKKTSDNIEIMELELKRLLELKSTDPKMLSKKKKLENSIENLQKDADTEKIKKLKDESSELDTKISSYDTINKMNKDLEEVKSRIEKNTKELDEVEMALSLIKDYHKEYSELVANELNSKLKNTRIKTFKLQKNGDIKETFEITMNGVPYSSLNSAGKIIAGIELIQLIKECLGMNFPIIIDNKESITRDFNLDNQLITLKVEKGVALGV